MASLDELRAATPPRRDGESNNDYARRLPQQRTTAHDVRGRLLFLPLTHLVVVPVEPHRGSWTVVVVAGTDLYPRNGYALDVGDLELTRAVEIDLELVDDVATLPVGWEEMLRADEARARCGPDPAGVAATGRS